MLATEAVKCLKQMVSDFQYDGSEAAQRGDLWWDSLRVAAYHIIYSGRPSMNAAISSALLQARERILPLSKSKTPHFARYSRKLKNAIFEREETLKKILEAFCTLVTSLYSEKEDNNHSQTINILILSSCPTIRLYLLNLLSSNADIQVRLSSLEF